MIAHAGCILDRIGNPANDVRGKLPADIINPIFAFSLNRELRYLYDGEYFRFKDKNGEADYPSTTPDMSEDVELLKIYDQKEKFGYNKEDAVVGLNIDPSFELPSGPNNGHHRDFNYVGTNLVRPKIIALNSNPGKNITEGNIYEVSLIRFQGGGFICRIVTDDGGSRFIGNRGVEYEVVTGQPPKLKFEDGFYKAVFSGSEFMSIASTHNIQDEFYIGFVGKSDYPRPGLGLWGPNQSVTVEPSTSGVGKFTVNRNRGGMLRESGGPLRVGGLVKIIRTTHPHFGSVGRITNLGAGGLALDHTDPYDGERELDGGVTYSSEGTSWVRVDSNVYGCFYGHDANQNNQRVMSVNEIGHNVKSETINNIENIGIGRAGDRYYIGEVLEVVMHLGDLKQKWGDLITANTQSFYRTYE